MTTLIITLPDAAADPADPATEWEHVRTADAVVLSPPARAPLALLPTSDDVVAVVPVQALSWHRVQLPRGTWSRGVFGEAAGARLRAVLAGLLEDVLLDDPADLHFALEPGARDGVPIWVAACDRAWLAQALAQLEKTGHRANRVVPQWTPQPEEDALWIVGMPGDVWALRAGPQGVQRWPLSGALLGLLGDPGLPVWAPPDLVAQAEAVLQRPVRLQEPGQIALRAAAASWNLAQFELASTGGSRLRRRVAQGLHDMATARRWRAFRLAVALGLLVQLLGLNAWAWREDAAVQALRQATRDVLTQTFPQIRVVVDPPAQMARELQALQRGSGQASGRDFATLLAAFAAAAGPGVQPEAIDYVAGELRLQGAGAASQALVQRLQSVGYSVREDGRQLVLRTREAP